MDDEIRDLEQGSNAEFLDPMKMEVVAADAYHSLEERFPRTANWEQSRACDMVSDSIKRRLDSRGYVTSQHTFDDRSPEYHNTSMPGDHVFLSVSLDNGKRYVVDGAYKQFITKDARSQQPNVLVIEATTPEEMSAELSNKNIPKENHVAWISKMFPR